MGILASDAESFHGLLGAWGSRGAAAPPAVRPRSFPVSLDIRYT